MEFYAGLDVSLETTSVCVVDREGKVIREGKLASDPDAIETFLAEWGIHLKRIGLEAFSFSGWLFTGLEEKGLPVVCIETRHAKAAMNAMLNKTDKNDARGIAQMMRTGWFRAVHVKSGEAQTLRALLVGRKAMLGKVIDMENMIRGLLRRSTEGRTLDGPVRRQDTQLPGWPSWKPSSRRCWTRDTRSIATGQAASSGSGGSA
jgi:transposase